MRRRIAGPVAARRWRGRTRGATFATAGSGRAFLSVHPDTGDVIHGTGGIRKIRWTMPGRGKRGGSRVVYYWLAKEDHIYLLTLYAKGVKDDLTAAERDAWRKAVEAINND